MEDAPLVVSTIGYGAFLAGPPLLGYLGDHVGTLDALLVVAVLMVPAAFSVFAARPSASPAADPSEARSADGGFRRWARQAVAPRRR